MRRAATVPLLALALLAGGMLAGCETTSGSSSSAPERVGFTCCNLHHEGDWINDGNYAELPMIPAGTPAQVTSYGRNYARATIGGQPMRLGHDYGREQESLDQWVAKMVVPTDPKLKLATWPAQVQDAVREGKVMVGMTKEQVIMSIGYPITAETPSLDADLWRYWVSSFGEYQLLWDGQGRVKSITAEPLVANMIVYRPKS